ncbi:putative hemolysin [Mizugakiibacter sediminis]|uniref:L-ornithine N(alpha)-acyltransferase n=3 Tax=Mizugakiibacter sediminis TaxID=1475481 RepID=A0A0K8QPH7_9GAMM|nr:lysophospholipid acyltransferase family protein [Mizugakiibacter sediminis]GAP66312.1 putative hemolysin [Mizugakiibacter sediminis]
MLSIERTLDRRLPWLAQHPRLKRPVVGLLGKLAAEERFNRALAGLAPLEGFDFVERVLDHLGVGYSVGHSEREHIPAEGPVVAVANHPLGMLDALALLHLVGSVRRDVRILGNDVLAAFAPLRRLLLPVDVFGGGAPRGRLREAYRALDDGQALIVFPAGEVSRVGPAGVRDGRWSPGFARLALRSGAPVLPVHVEARNSAMFYGMSMLAPPLAAALLPREVFAARRTRIVFSIGGQIPAAELARAGGSPRQLARLMRRHVYRLPRRRAALFGAQGPVAHPEPAAAVRTALGRGEVLAELADGKRLILLPGAPDCPALRELGRLRELSFRRVGEGSGRRRDLDAYDAHYEHLILWDEAALAIAGAYRLGHGGSILAARGLAGLYSAALFRYAPAAEPVLRQGLELGRSFVAPAYWRSRALDRLWQGIGLYLQRHPELRHLVGPVSLSAALPREARERIVAAHEHYFGASGLAEALRPFRPAADTLAAVRALLDGRDAESGLAALRRDLAAQGVALPVLYRQYVDLCEPAGVRFLAFGEDPDFAGCVDGLVVLDLARLKPAKRARYLGGRVETDGI